MSDARDVILKVLHSYSTKDSFIDWERSDADAVLAALAAAGLVVVPREPETGHDKKSCFWCRGSAMVEAAHGE